MTCVPMTRFILQILLPTPRSGPLVPLRVQGCWIKTGQQRATSSPSLVPLHHLRIIFGFCSFVWLPIGPGLQRESLSFMWAFSFGTETHRAPLVTTDTGCSNSCCLETKNGFHTAMLLWSSLFCGWLLCYEVLKKLNFNFVGAPLKMMTFYKPKKTTIMRCTGCLMITAPWLLICGWSKGKVSLESGASLNFAELFLGPSPTCPQHFTQTCS